MPQPIDVAGVILVRTTVEDSCPVCKTTRVGGPHFESGIKHLIEKHDCKLLHVGQETSTHPSGDFVQLTVGVVGIPPDSAVHRL